MPHNNPPPSGYHYPLWHGWRLLLKDLALPEAHVLRRAQLPSDLFSRESASLSTAQYFQLWTALEAESDAAGAPEPLPIRIARAMSADWFEPALFAALCSADLNAALARIARYKRLVAPMALQLDISPQGTRLGLSWLDQSQRPPAVLVAFDLVFFVQLARMATRANITPAAVVCPAPQPALAPYEAFFACAVSEGPQPSLTFTPEDAQRPFLTVNHGMWQFFEPTLRKRLHDLDRQSSTAERVRSALLEALPAGDLSMEAVCRKLGVSTRTLQRRLREEGSSFQATLNGVRTQLAHHYLENSALSGAEISFLLGFEDPNSFVRAFQAWTGKTPQAMRKRSSSPAQLWAFAPKQKAPGET
ncbi:AraC family transcriptional regulator ligand-binding domain-containing protein [Roseateles sp. BYS180W]|uniref:AraC family transcriptional regulator ligand-binding domain-containing protein n=1 Tax=Roseateles rivi TaxID=3299028 RepID=A0ABW7FUU4_9BURK